MFDPFGRGSTAIAFSRSILAGVDVGDCRGFVFAVFRLGAMPLVAAAQSPPSQDPAAMRQEIEQLRKELDELKGQYESRLAALEAKLSAQPAEQAAAAPAPPPPPARQHCPDQPGLQPTGQARRRRRTSSTRRRRSSATSSARPDTIRCNPQPALRDAGIRGVVPGGGRSVRARGLLHLVRRRRRRSRGRASSRSRRSLAAC